MTDEELGHFREVIQKLQIGGSPEYELNLACWLGERAHYLIAELDRLRALNARLAEACEETVRMLGDDCHRYKAGEKARAALADNR